MRSARLNANLAMAGILTAAVLLYKFPPEQYAFYPTCPVYRYLHLYCPGCGGTRALAALLHGHFAQAMHYNSLFVLLLPAFLVIGGYAYWSAVTRNRVAWPHLPQPAVTLLLALMAVFAVGRNL